MLKVQAGEACRLGWGATTLVSVVGTVRVGASGRCFALEDGTGFVEVSLMTKQPPRCTGTTVRCLGHIVDRPDGRRLHATSVTVVDSTWERIHAREVRNLRAAGVCCSAQASTVVGAEEQKGGEACDAMAPPLPRQAIETAAAEWLPSQVSPAAIVESTPATVEVLLLSFIRACASGCSAEQISQSSEFGCFNTARVQDALEQLQLAGDIYVADGEVFRCLYEERHLFSKTSVRMASFVGATLH